MNRVAVLGAGSFGTALAIHLSRDRDRVWLWARRPEQAQRLAEMRRNEDYLPEVEFPSALVPTSDLGEVASASLVIMAVPSHGFREVLQRFLAAAGSRPGLRLVSATKGVERESLARMSQVSFEEGVAADRDLRFGVLSGPSFAVELAEGKPTAAVIASEDGDLAEELQADLSSQELRLYSSTDVVGVELGGATKNVIAIASGLVSGLGLGYNTTAALLTRGLHEITRLGVACGGSPRTFSGLAGLGDLVLTCMGGLSRNRRAGLALAEGKSLWELEKTTGMIAEGVRNSLSITRLAERQGVEMPITEEMVQVIYHGRDPRRAVQALMRRELKAEAEL